MADSEEMISKKEVLEQTGITYGQFYRWKRQGLIPESWFDRRSTFTGQEAFLPKEKVLERIARIKALKDEKSLEEIAALLSPETAGQPIERETLESQKWVSPEVLEYYTVALGRSGPFTFTEVCELAVLEQLRSLDLEPEEISLALATLHGDHLNFGDGKLGWLLLIARKEIKLTLLPAAKRRAISFCCIVPSGQFRLDPESEVVVQLDLNRLLEETKMKMHLGA